jgi:superfamily II DNA or RNA helicase
MSKIFTATKLNAFVSIVNFKPTDSTMFTVQNNKYLMFDRYVHRIKNIKIIDMRPELQKVKHIPTLNVELKPPQKFAIEQIKKYIAKDKNPQIVLGCGIGKTLTAIAHIIERGIPTLIILRKKNEIEQYIEEGKQFCKKFIEGKHYAIYRNDNKVKAKTTPLFTFAIVNTVISLSGRKALKGKFSQIIYDECHKYCTDKFSRVFNVFMFDSSIHSIIGMTATPDEESRIEKFCVIACRITNEYAGLPLEVKFKSIRGVDVDMSSYTAATKSIEESEIVVQKILDIINRLSEDRVIAVFCRTRKLVDKLVEQDDSIGACYSNKHFASESKKRVIACTRQILADAFNKKDLNCLILVDSVKDNAKGKLEQIVGRIMRKDHLDCSPLVIDLHISSNYFTKKHVTSRSNYYKTLQ